MGWNICLKIHTGNKDDSVIADCEANMTYNVSSMYCDCFEGITENGLRGFHTMNAIEAQSKLRHGIDRMKSQPEIYKAMNPKNGWGNYEVALELLEKMLLWCLNHPKGYFYIS